MKLKLGRNADNTGKLLIDIYTMPKECKGRRYLKPERDAKVEVKQFVRVRFIIDGRQYSGQLTSLRLGEGNIILISRGKGFFLYFQMHTYLAVMGKCRQPAL